MGGVYKILSWPFHLSVVTIIANAEFVIFLLCVFRTNLNAQLPFANSRNMAYDYTFQWDTNPKAFKLS